MSRLQAVLGQAAANGIYRVSSQPLADLTAAAAAAQTPFALLQGDAIANKAAFLDACATALQLPPYFGRNWDALADCLMDRQVVPAAGQTILYDYPAPLIRQAPATWATALSIFEEAAAYWRDHDRPFTLLLRRTAGMTPTIKLLDR